MIYEFKNFQDLLVEITAEFRQARHVKVSHLEVGMVACFRHASRIGGRVSLCSRDKQWSPIQIGAVFDTIPARDGWTHG